MHGGISRAFYRVRSSVYHKGRNKVYSLLSGCTQ